MAPVNQRQNFLIQTHGSAGGRNKERYSDRFIVLDAPAIQQSTEARILAQYCDFSMLVVPFGKVVTDEVLSAIDALGKEHFAGLVFNS